jgi:hypothetical protein
MDNLITEAFNKRKKTLKITDIIQLATELNIKTFKTNPKGKQIKRTKTLLLEDIDRKIKQITNEELIDLIKKTKIGIELEVKHILSKDIDIDELISKKICLPLTTFFEENPSLKTKFVKECNLVNINNVIKTLNCEQLEVQGLYILTISKDNVDYIVKLCSFAESQGMFKRITSFGGGNYETGSLTNKWFQEFIKRALTKGYTSKFTYYNKIQKKY